MTSKPTVTFQREYCEEFIPEIIPILANHYDELAVNKEHVPLDPNFDGYREKELEGRLHIFTARLGRELIGYIIGFIDNNHLHYKSTVHYLNDIYYVKAEYRSNGVGARFFIAHEKELKTFGVERIVQFTKNHKSHQAMFEAMGYAVTDIILTKML